MNNPSSLSRYILVILCVAIVFTALVLIVLNSIVQNKRLSGLKSGIPAIDQIMTGQSYEDGYRAGYKAAREKGGFLMPTPTGAPVLSLSGTIESVSADKVVFKVLSMDTDELVDGVSSSRTAVIATSTQILVRKYLNQVELAKQMEQTSKNKALAVPYMENTGKTTDLKPGQDIAVTAKEDIGLKDEFTVAQIIVTVMPETAK